MKILRLILLGGILFTQHVLNLSAATWDGGLSHANFTVNNLWSTANNWVSGVPVSSATTDVIFSQSGAWTTSSQNIASPFTLRSLTFDSSANVTALSGSALNLAAGGTITQNSSIAVNVSTPVTLNTTATFTGHGAGMLSMNGVISGSGSFKLVGDAGAGLKLSLNQVNIFSGAMLVGEVASGFTPVDVTFGNNQAVGSAALQFFNGNTLRASNGARTISNPLGLFSNGNGLQNQFTFGSGDDLAFSGAINVSAASKTVRVDNSITTFAGSISGTAPITKTGAGTLQLKGNNQSFTGSWTINEGALKLADDQSLTNNAVSLNSPGALDLTSIGSAGVTSMNGTGPTLLGNAVLTVGLNNVDSDYKGTVTAANTVSGSLKKTGTGSLVLSGASSFFNTLVLENGSSTLTSGSLSLNVGFTLGGTTNSPALIVTNGFDLISGGGSASTLISGGVGTRAVFDGPGTTWQIGFQCVVAGGLGPGQSTGFLAIKNQAFVNGIFMLAGAGGGNGVGSLQIDTGGKVLTQAGIVGFVSGSEGLALVTDPGSSWTNVVSMGLGGFNSDLLNGRGTLTVSNNAVVYCNGETTFWSPGSILNVDGGRYYTDTLVLYSNAGTVLLSDFDEATPALTVGINGSSCTFAGSMGNSSTAPGSLSKVGGGTVTLTGPLSYTGFTRVLGGKLVVTRSNPFAGITQVGNGGSLQINGTWGNNLFSQSTIAVGGTLTGTGTLRGSLTNSGLVEITDGKSLVCPGTVVNNGVMRFRKGATFTASGQLVNNGIIDIMSAGVVVFPPGFTNHGVIRDRSSLQLKITKVGSLVTIQGNPLFGGHQYQLYWSDSPHAGFVPLGIPFFVGADQSFSTDLGDDSLQKFYRFKID